MVKKILTAREEADGEIQKHHHASDGFDSFDKDISLSFQDSLSQRENKQIWRRSLNNVIDGADNGCFAFCGWASRICHLGRPAESEKRVSVKGCPRWRKKVFSERRSPNKSHSTNSCQVSYWIAGHFFVSRRRHYDILVRKDGRKVNGPFVESLERRCITASPKSGVRCGWLQSGAAQA